MSSSVGRYERIGLAIDQKGEKAKQRRKRRSEKRGSAHIAWSKAIKTRDQRCVKCGEEEFLHAHHIKPRKTHPWLALTLSNGMTLCPPCHRAEHPELPDCLFGLDRNGLADGEE